MANSLKTCKLEHFLSGTVPAAAHGTQTLTMDDERVDLWQPTATAMQDPRPNRKTKELPAGRAL
jgi:hypothetical protein